jgi:predicted dehydrogenase
MSNANLGARLRLGMVGGGRGAFIGEAHRIAARLDDRYELVAGALSADPQRAIESGRDLRLDPMRCYTDWRGMAQAEATRKDGIRVVSVVTPNVSHHAICKTFLEAGIDVICDKPLTTTLAEAQELLAITRRTGRLLGVTYTYTGYPMVREARALIETGALGAVRIVQVEFTLGWLSGPTEGDSKQAAWRTDPAQAGASFIVGALGTHCFHLSEFVTGRRTAALAADLQTMVPGRRLEDNAHILLRYDNGARGTMWVSAVAAGEQVGLRLRVYGEKGHIAWEQSDPDKLRLAIQGEAVRTLVRGQGGLSPAAKRATRIVAGLPEGYFEAFATLYRDYADILAARQTDVAPDPLALWAPLAEDGVRGMAFVEAALASHAEGGSWLDFRPEI